VEALVKEAGARDSHEPEKSKQPGHTAIAVGIAAVVLFGLTGGVAFASSGSGNRTGPGAQTPLASPSAATSLTPAASPTPSPTPSSVLPAAAGSWVVNGATLKAGGTMAGELDTGGNAFAAQVSASKGAWTTRVAITGQGPVTLNGTITGPGPRIDATVDAFGFPVELHGTPGKDLSVTVGPRSTAMLTAYTRPAGVAPAAGLSADALNPTAAQLGQGWIRTVVVFTIVGWLALLVAPGLRSRGRVSIRSSPWKRLGLGFILLLDIPLTMLLILLLGVPLGVWWLGIIGLVLFAALCVVGYAYSGFQLGALIIDRVWDDRHAWLIAVPFGVALLAFIGLVPYVGPLSLLVAVVYGLGSMLYAPGEPLPAQLGPATEAIMAPAAVSSAAPSKPIVE
jgi:hypothetical protein